MQLDLSQEIIRMFIERIVNETFPDETGAFRLQQIGLFTLIYALQGDKEPVTAALLSVMMGQTDSQIHRQLKNLMARGLVERTQIKNKQGRGQAWALSIKHNAKTMRLVEAISKAGGKRK